MTKIHQGPWLSCITCNPEAKREKRDRKIRFRKDGVDAKIKEMRIM
jgi:hypothetical protein